MSVEAKIRLEAPIGSFYNCTDVLIRFRSILTQREIRDFITISPHIFFFKQRDVPGGPCNGGWDDKDGHYISEVDEHLMFRYRVVRYIDKGAFGQVLHCFDHKTGQDVAIKVLRHDSKPNICNFMAELNVNIVLEAAGGNPNVVRFLDCFNFRGHTCFVFQFVTGKDLFEHIPTGGLPIKDVKRFSVSILKGMLHLKNCGIIHADMKPENILVADSQRAHLCIADFGYSVQESKERKTVGGTQCYMSPEVYLKNDVTCATDMWALGCIVVQMATGRRVFENRRRKFLQEFVEVLGPPPKTIAEHSKGSLEISANGESAFVNGRFTAANIFPLSKKLRLVKDYKLLDFVKKCIMWDPAKRMTPKEALEHPWLKYCSVPTPSCMAITAAASVFTTPILVTPAANASPPTTSTSTLFISVTPPAMAASPPASPPATPPPPPEKHEAWPTEPVRGRFARAMSCLWSIVLRCFCQSSCGCTEDKAESFSV